MNFARYIWMTASILQRLLALYLRITYNWQLSSSKTSLVKNNSSIYFKEFSDLDFFCTDIFLAFFFFLFFFIFLDKGLFTLLVTQNVCYTFEMSTALLARRHLNTMLLSNSENLNSISNIFGETYDF